LVRAGRELICQRIGAAFIVIVLVLLLVIDFVFPFDHDHEHEHEISEFIAGIPSLFFLRADCELLHGSYVLRWKD
jgi:hypothetical protein